MSNVEFDSLTFGPFRIAEAVYQTRSVSKAAQLLGLSQPAVSVGLARLRKKTGDQLFVRTRAGMMPTPRGEEILEAARRSVAILAEVLKEKAPFDPTSTTRQFTIAINQITQMTLFPRILRRLVSEAPRARILAIPITAETLKNFGAGTLDLAIGDIAELQPGCIKKTVLTDDYVCLVSKLHPRITDAISQEQFQAERHVTVAGVGSVMRAAEDWMRRKKIERRVQVQIPDFLGLETIVADSEMIATMPRTLAELVAVRRPIRLLEHPYALPRSSSKIYWHERQHRDEGHRWFRELVVQMLLKYGRRRLSGT
ncbi:MAG: LysR family transcriptional regulator [Variovorax sp.]